MVITAKFTSNCPNCGSQIQVGDRVEWTRGSRASHVNCQPAARPQLSEDDPEFGREDPRSPHFYGKGSCRPATCPLHQHRCSANCTTRHEELDARTRCQHPQLHRSDCTCGIVYFQGTDADDTSYEAWLAFQASRPTTIVVEDAGVYVLPDGAIVKVQANREKTRTYAKRWTVIGGQRLTEADTREHGEYVYEAGLVQTVAATGRKMSLEEAKAFILRYGVCARCGRGLKDATSVERGIGPVCIKYFAEGTTGADVLADEQDAADAAADHEIERQAGELPGWMTTQRTDDEQALLAGTYDFDRKRRDVQSFLARKGLSPRF